MTKGLLKNRLTKDAGAKDRRKVFCPCVCSNELLFCGNYLCTRGCLFNLLDCVLESLSGLEGRCLGRGDVDLGSGRGIPADAGGALFDLERAKPTNCTLSPDFSALSVAVRKAVNAASQSFLERPLVSAIAAIISALFMMCSLLLSYILVWDVTVLYRKCQNFAIRRRKLLPSMSRRWEIHLAEEPEPTA